MYKMFSYKLLLICLLFTSLTHGKGSLNDIQINSIEEAKSIFNESLITLSKADIYDDHIKYYNSIKSAAEFGYGKAQVMMGIFHHYGVHDDILKPQYEESKNWFEKAIKNNEKTAYLAYAYLYIEDKVIKQDLEKAISLISKGADENHLEAQEYLGDVYSSGYFHTNIIDLTFDKNIHYEYSDEKKAYDIYTLALKNNSSKANRYLANHYKDKDVERAIKFFETAIQLGNENSLFDYGMMLSNQNKNENSLLKGFEYIADYLESQGIERRESQLVYRFLRKYFLNPELDISKGAYNRLRSALNKPASRASSILELIEPVIVRYQYQNYPNFDSFFTEMKYEGYTKEHLFGWQLTQLLYLPLPVEITESFKTLKEQNFNFDNQTLSQLNDGVNEYLRWDDGHFVLKINNTSDLNINNIIFSVPNACDVQDQEVNMTYHNISLGEFVLQKQSSQVYKVPIGLTKENDKCVSIVGVL